MNWQANYKATFGGMISAVKDSPENKASNPMYRLIVKYQCAFTVGIQAIASEEEDKHLDGRYIPPLMWRMLLKEWRRDEQILRGLDDAVGGES